MLVTHWLTNSLTNSLTHSRLVNLIDVTLASEDAYSKLVEVVTVADVDDENRVGSSLLQIWKLRFGQKANQKAVASMILSISNSKNLNKFWVGIFTRQGHINQVY